MGTWGAKVYQNDVALDVRYEYKELLRYGKSGVEATRELIEKMWLYWKMLMTL